MSPDKGETTYVHYTCYWQGLGDNTPHWLGQFVGCHLQTRWYPLQMIREGLPLCLPESSGTLYCDQHTTDSITWLQPDTHSLIDSVIS